MRARFFTAVPPTDDDKGDSSSDIFVAMRPPNTDFTVSTIQKRHLLGGSGCTADGRETLG
jgi:hypothetical protein